MESCFCPVWLSGLLRQLIQFPVNACCISLGPLCQIPPLNHPGSWFSMRAACPSFNCMIWHKQKEILCWGREYSAASDFSCQLIRICRVPTRSNGIRKKMQCVPVCVSNNCIIYVNRTNEGGNVKANIDCQLQDSRHKKPLLLCYAQRERTVIAGILNSADSIMLCCPSHAGAVKKRCLLFRGSKHRVSQIKEMPHSTFITLLRLLVRGLEALSVIATAEALCCESIA